MGNADSSMDGLLNSGCRIVVLGSRSSEFLTHLSGLPKEARILATGVTLEQLQKDGSFLAEGNVLLHIDGDAETVQEVIDAMPFLMWVHTIHSGVEELLCPFLVVFVVDPRTVRLQVRRVVELCAAVQAIAMCTAQVEQTRVERRREVRLFLSLFFLMLLEFKFIFVIFVIFVIFIFFIFSIFPFLLHLLLAECSGPQIVLGYACLDVQIVDSVTRLAHICLLPLRVTGRRLVLNELFLVLLGVGFGLAPAL
jgi:hypothetical protein